MIVEVVGLPVRHLGRLVRPGARIDLAEPMARALASQGRARVIDEKPPTVAASPEATRNTTHQKRR